MVVVHHLVVDGVSLRILLEDLATGGAQLAAGRAPVLEPCRTSFRRWAQLLVDKRWGADRLQQEIDSAKAAAASQRKGK